MDEDFQRIVALLQENSEQSRADAAREAAQLNTPEIVDDLRQALEKAVEDISPEVRQKIAEAMGNQVTEQKEKTDLTREEELQRIREEMALLVDMKPDTDALEKPNVPSIRINPQHKGTEIFLS